MLQSLTKYRSELMGFAILWVILFHSGITFGVFYPLIKIGYGGVDIFLFLSGLGLYFSSLKAEDLLTFYKRRFQRIFPSYIIVVLITMFCLGTFSLFTYLLYISTVGFWINGTYFEWYVPSMIMFYLVFPFYVRLFKKHPYATTMAAFVVAALLVFLRIYLQWGDYLMLFFTRIPIFCLGVLFGKFAFEKQTPAWMSKSLLYVLALASMGLLFFFINYWELYLWSWGLNWYPFIGIIPGLCVGISSLFEKVNSSYLNQFFAFFGALSLELYLIHLKIFDKAPALAEHYHIPKAMVLVLILAAAIPLSYLLSKAVNRVLQPKSAK